MNAPQRNFAWWAKQHFNAIWWTTFVACAAPACWLAAAWMNGSLGVNPLNRLQAFTGRWAVTMLLISLAITPARRLSMKISQAMLARYGKRVSDWNWLIRLRRQLGLFAFFYASLHVGVYLGLDVGLDGQAIVGDLQDRPSLLIGLLAFALLIPLAATSNQLSIRMLGRGWRRLHMASYSIAVLAITHDWLQMKVGRFDPWPYTLALVVLLAARAVAWRRGDRGPGVEEKER